MIAADAMERLGIERGGYIVKVNNRKVLDGVLEAIGLGGKDNAGRRLTVLRAIDKLDKFSADEVRKLLGPGRWDGGEEEGKGDFTKGANLSSADADVVLAVTQKRDDWRQAIAARRKVYLAKSEVGQAGVSELEEIARETIVTASGYGSDRISIDHFRRPRPRILHWSGLRMRTHARNQGRKRPARALRVRSAAAGPL